MDNTIVYQVNNQNILFSQLGDEGVMFDIEKNEYKILNETLFQIFSRLQSGKTALEICSALVAEYEVSPEKCRQKVEETINLMLKNKYILPAQIN